MKKTITLLLLLLFTISCQSTLSPEELDAKWRAPIVGTAFNLAACEGLTTTAQNVQSGATDGFTGLGELIGIGAIVLAVDEMVNEAEPAVDQTELYAQIGTDIEAIRGVLGPWIDGEITSTDVLETIDSTCGDINSTFEQATSAAERDGMTNEQMTTIFNEVATAMQNALETTE